MSANATPPDRRRFLSRSAGALALLDTPALAAEGPKDDFAGFTVGVQSYSFRKFNLDQALKRVNELGLRFVEFSRGHVPTDSTPEQVRAVKKLCAEYQITPIAFGVERFTKDHEANQRIFDFAAALGVKHLSADPDPDSFDSLDKLVAHYNISIAIHPHGPVGGRLHRWYSAGEILKAVKDHHPRIGSCLDTGHLIRAAQLGEKLDPAAQVRAMGRRNFGMHLKDHDNPTKTDVVFGRGELDVPGVLKTLREVGFKGYVAIEYEANPDHPSPDIRRCADILRDAARALGS